MNRPLVIPWVVIRETSSLEMALAMCSTPHEFNPAQVRLSIMESSRTSNGLNRKAIRHPYGTLINYIFTALKVLMANHMKRGRNHTVNRNRVLAEAKYYKFSVHKHRGKKQTEFLRKFHTVDNVRLLIRTTSCPRPDSPKSAHCGGEPGI